MSPLPVTDATAESADGTRIHLYSVGRGGPALVLCDGVGCDGYIWKYVAAEFGKEREVVRWHYRGHGTSDRPSDPSHMRLDDLCDDLTAVLDARGIDKAVLLGHSLGVQVILEYYRRQPNRVLGLVPMCGSYRRPIDTFRDKAVMKDVFPFIHKAVHLFPDATKKLWGILDSDFALFVAMNGGDVNGRLVKREDFIPYLEHMAKIDPRVFVDLVRDAGENDATDILPTVRVPTLVIAAESDLFTPAWISRTMAERIPNAELCVIPRGTHTAPLEQPDLVNLRVRRFLEENGLGATSLDQPAVVAPPARLDATA